MAVTRKKVAMDLYSALSRTRLECVSQLVQPGTSRPTTLRDNGYGLVYHALCLFTPSAFARYSFQPATDGGLRLSRPGCLVLRRGGLPVLAYTPNWPVALFLLLLHPPGTLYLLTFDCAKTFSLSNVT